MGQHTGQAEKGRLFLWVFSIHIWLNLGRRRERGSDVGCISLLTAKVRGAGLAHEEVAFLITNHDSATVLQASN